MDLYSQKEKDPINPPLQDFEILAPERCAAFASSIDRLISNLKSMIHTLLIAPRGYGKHQIVSCVTSKMMFEEPFFRICHMDLKGVRSLEEFKRALRESTFELPLREHAGNKHAPEGIDETLLLPELIALRLSIRIIFFVGNFQILLRFDPDLTLLKKMNRIWKESKHCAFCLYGSQEQLERDLIYNGRVFIKGFVKIIKLPLPDTPSLIRGIKTQFRIRGKRIEESAVRHAIICCSQHPYYIRLLTWHALLLTKRNCTSREIDRALTQLIDHYRVYYRQKAESLTRFQLNFLEAYLSEWSRLCSREALGKYDLRSSSHVARIKESLGRKEIFYLLNGEIYLMDPLFCHWLKRDYF